MVVTETKPVPSWWEISLLWVSANILSIFGGILLGTFLNDILWSSNFPPRVDGIIIDGVITNPIQRAIIIGISIGSFKGFLEWLVLQRYEAKWKGWLPISTLAWVIGVTIAVGLPAINPHLEINALAGGTLLGVIQWSLVRQFIPKAYWWIVCTVIGSFAVLTYIPLGYTFLMILEGFLAFLLAGLFMGVATGATLAWLLQFSWLKK